MKKLILCTAVAATLSVGVSTSASAALATNALLAFDDGIVGSNSSGDPIVTGGSFFGMDGNSNGSISKAERVALVANDGLLLGTTQAASGSHGGIPDGSATAGIDNEWLFFNNTGLHLTTSPTNVSNAVGNTADVDFSGWAVTWNTIPEINMGGGLQDCGTARDGVCVKNNFDANGNITGTTDVSGTFDNGTGVANIVCGVDCATGDSFTLTYDAVVPQADPSNFGGVSYTLELVGTIADGPAAVPVPAAVWLFGSGLLGLVGVARRKVA